MSRHNPRTKTVTALTLLLAAVGCSYSSAEQKNLESSFLEQRFVAVLRKIERQCGDEPLGIPRFSSIDRSAPLTGDPPPTCKSVTTPVIEAIQQGQIAVVMMPPGTGGLATFEGDRNDWFRKRGARFSLSSIDFLNHEYNFGSVLHEAVHAKQWLVDGDRHDYASMHYVEGDALIVEGNYIARFSNLGAYPADRLEVATALAKLATASDPTAEVRPIVRRMYGEIALSDTLRYAMEDLTAGISLQIEGKPATWGADENALFVQTTSEVTQRLAKHAKSLLATDIPTGKISRNDIILFSSWARFSPTLIDIIGHIPELKFLDTHALRKKEGIYIKIEEVNEKLQANFNADTLYALHLINAFHAQTSK